VWELATGRLLQTIRVPIGSGHEGKIFAVGLSPDGRTIVCGGFTGAEHSHDLPIYVLDRATGRMLHRITGLRDVTERLVFSADGRFLAATLHDKSGLRVYKSGDWRLLGTGAGYGDVCYVTDFDGPGRL